MESSIRWPHRIDPPRRDANFFSVCLEAAASENRPPLSGWAVDELGSRTRPVGTRTGSLKGLERQFVIDEPFLDLIEAGLAEVLDSEQFRFGSRRQLAK